MNERYETEHRIRFAGRQMPHVRQINERTADAQVQVAIGPLVLWLESKPAVDRLFLAWRSGATYTQLPNDAQLPNPVGSNISQVASGLTVGGDFPSYVMRVITPPGARSPFLRLQVDVRLALEVLDKPAYLSIGSALTRAAALAPATFLEPAQLPLPILGPRGRDHRARRAAGAQPRQSRSFEQGHTLGRSLQPRRLD